MRSIGSATAARLWRPRPRACSVARASTSNASARCSPVTYGLGSECDDRGALLPRLRARQLSAARALVEGESPGAVLHLAWIADPTMHVDADHPRRLSDTAATLDKHAQELRAALTGT